MNKPYSFSIDQMNGIVEDTYAKIINECENLKKNTNCPCLLYTSPSPRDKRQSRMPSSA